jgi:hypothetical protein
LEELTPEQGSSLGSVLALQHFIVKIKFQTSLIKSIPVVSKMTTFDL